MLNFIMMPKDNCWYFTCTVTTEYKLSNDWIKKVLTIKMNKITQLYLKGATIKSQIRNTALIRKEQIYTNAKGVVVITEDL